MKLSKVLLFGILLVAFPALSQTKSDVFMKDIPVTWLGLDFTSAKLIGDRERLGSESDVRHLLDAWNDLILAEQDKFDVAKAIGRAKVDNVIDVTKQHNAELDVMSMFSDNERDYLHIKVSDVEEIIAGYDFKDLSGIGLMFNVESFNKINVEGSVWITFINLGTKEVLFTERLVAPPSGMGMRNYWAGCLYEIITKIRKKEFEMWRKKHYRP
jgi:hypothetical protein